jgi:hypothetical protein
MTSETGGGGGEKSGGEAKAASDTATSNKPGAGEPGGSGASTEVATGTEGSSETSSTAESNNAASTGTSAENTKGTDLAGADKTDGSATVSSTSSDGSVTGGDGDSNDVGSSSKKEGSSDKAGGTDSRSGNGNEKTDQGPGPVSKASIGGVGTLSSVFGEANIPRAANDDVGGTRHNQSDGTPVIGALDDTKVARDWEGHAVIDIDQRANPNANEVWAEAHARGDLRPDDGRPVTEPGWSPELNKEWINSIVNNRAIVYLGSEPAGDNLLSRDHKHPSVFSNEINQLQDAGYERVGDYLVPGDLAQAFADRYRSPTDEDQS